MTHNEIEVYRQKLIEIRKIDDSGERNKAYIGLAAELGASGCGGDRPPGERDAEHIRSINQALQTATMIDLSKTAAQGYDMAINASRSASKQFCIAATIALLSAVAAWAAVVVSALRNP